MSLDVEDRIALTALETYCLRLALGFSPVNRAKVAVKNHYDAVKGTETHKTFMDLISRGLALCVAENVREDFDRFAVSGRAARAVLRADESLSPDLEAI